MKSLDRYRTQLRLRMVSAVKSSTHHAFNHARQIVPIGDGRDGGHLRDCITASVLEEKARVTGIIAARNPHALHVEMGTSRMAAQPYLRPALRGQRAAFIQELSQ